MQGKIEEVVEDLVLGHVKYYGLPAREVVVKATTIIQKILGTWKSIKEAPKDGTELYTFVPLKWVEHKQCSRCQRPSGRWQVELNGKMVNYEPAFFIEKPKR